MSCRLLAAPLLALSLTLTVEAAAQNRPDVTVQDLRRHVEVLASDAFEGREPGTAGETKTLQYLVQQMRAVGLDPGAGRDWYQPIGIVIRKPHGHRLNWTADGRRVDFPQNNGIFIGRSASERISNAPVYFVGHGAVIRDRQIDHLAGADLRGAVALVLYDGPDVPNFPSYTERVRAVTAAGAAAVIGIIGDDIPWSSVAGSYAAGQNKLQSEAVPRVQGAIPIAVAARLIGDGGGDLARLMAQPGPSFRPVRLKLRADIEVTTRVNAFTTHNVVGRLRGSGASRENVLFLAHWDHLGICRPLGAADRICNGAVDNASGLAVMLEAARHLARAPRPERDILFLATTAEELGLLGAYHFAQSPIVPLRSIVAALNIDTVAITGEGEPVAVLGRGRTPIDRLADETAAELGRRVDNDRDSDPFLQRQDGWALMQAGVPAVMVGGSFSDMAKLGRFITSTYHRPEDDLSRPIELGGAAEDTELMIALARKLADPGAYSPPPR